MEERHWGSFSTNKCGHSSLWGLPPLDRWAWAVQEDNGPGAWNQVRKQGSFVVFASVLVSKFLPWAPALAYLQCFLSRLFLVSVLLQEQRRELEHTDTVLHMVLTFFLFPPPYFVSLSIFLLFRENVSRILYFVWNFVCMRHWRVNPGSLDAQRCILHR